MSNEIVGLDNEIIQKLLEDAVETKKIKGTEVAAAILKAKIPDEYSEKLTEELWNILNENKVIIINDDAKVDEILEDIDEELIDLELDDKAVMVTDSFRMYMKEIGKTPLLTHRKEIELAKRKDAGDPIAKEQMIKANLRLVVAIAGNYENRGLPMGDLVQEGNIGLIKAIDRYDWKKGFKFSTYATWWIRQSITRGIADQANTIRTPIHINELKNKLLTMDKKLSQKLNREPTDKELSEALSEIDPVFTVQKVNELRTLNQKPVSLDKAVGSDSDSDFAEFIADSAANQPLSKVMDSIKGDEIDKAFAGLPERESKVLKLRYGIDCRPRTLEQCGFKLRITRERVRQLQDRALDHLRTSPDAINVKNFLQDLDD